MFSLAEGEKKLLLQVARRALIAAVNRSKVMEALPQDAALASTAGAFVTLYRKGRLRGCIGQLPSKSQLVEIVAHCARAVASDDPRFPCVAAEELLSIDIEVSVLSELTDIKAADIVAGKHGLLVSSGLRRGVLLPQVAAQFRWDGIRFLEATCEKAGLDRDAWKSGETRVQAFTAEAFRESDFS